MNKTDNSSKMGQGMIYIAWLLFLALLTFGFNNYLEQQNNPNQVVTTNFDEYVSEVRLKQNRQGHYVANGQINHSPVTFMLDTGATLISIPEAIADRLKLKKGFPLLGMSFMKHLEMVQKEKQLILKYYRNSPG
jgi:aspartyl protease family protein